MSDLHGKVVVITGASSGIGLQTTMQLASRGAKVYFTARSESKAEQTIEAILSKCPQVSASHLQWLELDLTELDSVIRAIERLKRNEEKIHILINNAGEVFKDGAKLNAGAWDATLTSCYIGPFVLTHGILPLMKRAATEPGSDVRIVSLASILQSATALLGPDPLDFGSPLFFAGSRNRSWIWNYILCHLFNADMPAYANAKLATVVFAQELQRRLDIENVPIISTSVHPGAVRTQGALDVVGSWLRPVISWGMIDEETGSHTVLFAATAKDVADDPAKFKGNYLELMGQVCKKHPISEDQDQCRALWDTTMKEVNDYLTSQGHSPLVD